MLTGKLMGAGGVGGGLFVGDNYALGGSLSIPNHSAGDLIILVDGNSGSLAVPSTRSGFTNIRAIREDNFGTTSDYGLRLQYKFDSTGTTNSVTLGGNSGSVWVFKGLSSFGKLVTIADQSSPTGTWTVGPYSGLKTGSFLFATSICLSRFMVAADTTYDPWVINEGGPLGAWIEAVDRSTVSAAIHQTSITWGYKTVAVQFNPI